MKPEILAQLLGLIVFLVILGGLLFLAVRLTLRITRPKPKPVAIPKAAVSGWVWLALILVFGLIIYANARTVPAHRTLRVLPTWGRVALVGYGVASIAVFIWGAFALSRASSRQRVRIGWGMIGAILGTGLVLGSILHQVILFVVTGWFATFPAWGLLILWARFFAPDRRLRRLVKEANETREFDCAIDAVEAEVATRGPSRQRLDALGTLLMARERWAEALEVYRDWEHRYGRNAIALANQALCLQHLGRQDEAVALMAEAVAEEPKIPVLALNYGMMLADFDRDDEARAQLAAVEANAAQQQFADEAARAWFFETLERLRRRVGPIDEAAKKPVEPLEEL